MFAKARPLPDATASPPYGIPDPRSADRGWWHFLAALVALVAAGLWLWESGRPAPQPRERVRAPRRQAPPGTVVRAEPVPTPASPGPDAPADDIAAGAWFEAAEESAIPVPAPGVEVLEGPEITALLRLMAAEDWYGAEAAARAILDRHPGSAPACQVLGTSLYRQDRLRDALAAARECGDTELERRIERKLEAGAGFEERQVAHFHVRYDGEAHDAVSRDVVRVLESGYSRLVGELGFEPKRPIPVDMLSREAYVEETGKAWSAGEYSHGDGRIRVKVRGLTLTPDFEETLVHELCHAFLGDLSHGGTPREVNEGLAQYVTGRRIGWEATSRRDAELYPWKPFYDDALSFTEYLVGQRGVRGLVETLGRVGETGNLDGSFREVFGDDYRSLLLKWSARRRQMARSQG